MCASWEKRMSNKVLRHPDKEDIIKKLLSGESVKEVERWIKEKHPRSKGFRYPI